jgi:hypothetical protein
LLKSDSITALSKAYCKFQAEVKNPANSAVNPFYKSKYAPLNEILNDVRPLLSKHGLSVIQSPGSADGEHITITTLLLHESGEWLEGDPLTLRADKATPQGAGICSTYGRRYALSALLGISSEDDDDGNGAERQKSTPPSKPALKAELAATQLAELSYAQLLEVEKTTKAALDKMTKKPTPPPGKDEPVKWPSWWAGWKKLGLTEEDAHKIAGGSIKEFTRQQAVELMDKGRIIVGERKGA